MLEIYGIEQNNRGKNWGNLNFVPRMPSSPGAAASPTPVLAEEEDDDDILLIYLVDNVIF